MTDREGTIVVRLASVSRAVRGRFYRSLADAFAASPVRGEAMFESSVADPVPRAVVRPGHLLARWQGVPGLLVGDTVHAVRPRTVPGAPDRADRVADLRTVQDRPPLPRAGEPEAPLQGTVLRPGDWVGIQTFWAGGRTDGRIWVARRFRFVAPSEEAFRDRFDEIARTLATDWTSVTGLPTTVHSAPPKARSDWGQGGASGLGRGAWCALAPTDAHRSAEAAPVEPPAGRIGDAGHALILGGSGAGKTWLLADRAAAAIDRGDPTVALDLHGDLTPAIVRRLSASGARRVVAVDVTHRPVPGIAPLAGSDERAAGHLVAALKRLSPDGQDLYWGFRLERIFDAFVRIVQESGGSLLDLYALLTDADRRDVARLAVRSPDLARFLDELGPVVRRTPDFLWSAAARLAKVAVVPALAEFLSPPDGGLEVEELLENGRSLLLRIPFSEVGPEAAGFAGTLALARVYLGLAARRAVPGRYGPVRFVLDEVQGLSPRLVAELLTEGRKFGARVLLATQFPERLAGELRLAAAGVVREVVAFRVPRAGAETAGAWLGIGAAEAARRLAALPTGYALALDADREELRTVLPRPSIPTPGAPDWSRALARTHEEFAPTERPAAPETVSDEATDRLLLAILSAEERGRLVAAGRLVEAARELPGPGPDPARLADRAGSLERRGLVETTSDGLRLTAAGERRLGLHASTGATRESDEHRALLLRAFRLFARNGYALEIVRQGRYDTTLPDARYRQLPDTSRTGAPCDLAAALAQAERGWAWRCFRGRDVHVEAEVSGALRAARVRHGLAKASTRGAFALFVVADVAKASRVRKTLRSAGARPDRAQVWTLAPGVGTRRRPSAASDTPPLKDGN